MESPATACKRMAVASEQRPVLAASSLSPLAAYSCIVDLDGNTGSSMWVTWVVCYSKCGGACWLGSNLVVPRLPAEHIESWAQLGALCIACQASGTLHA